MAELIVHVFITNVNIALRYTLFIIKQFPSITTGGADSSKALETRRPTTKWVWQHF